VLIILYTILKNFKNLRMKKIRINKKKIVLNGLFQMKYIIIEILKIKNYLFMFFIFYFLFFIIFILFIYLFIFFSKKKIK